MMRIRIRWVNQQPSAEVQPGKRVQSRDLNRLLAIERRQDAGQPRSEHGFPHARRAVQEHVMSSRCCHLHDPTTLEMPTHLPEIQGRSLPGSHVFIGRRFPPAQRRFPVEHSDEILQMPDGPHRDPGHQGCLGFLTCRDDHLVKATPDRCE